VATPGLDPSPPGAPELPALDPNMSNETEAILLRIRERIAVRQVPRAPRHIRRGFVVASGLVAAYALAGVVAAVQLGLASMPALH